ncbi:MAG TPA: VOC family protein [Xanthobacteraceae bacterium]
MNCFNNDRPTDRNSQPSNCDAGGHHIAFKVDDLEAAKTFLADRGCRVMNGPIVLDQGPCATTRVNYVLDPFGNQLELVEYKTQAFETSAPVKIYRP